MHLFSHLCHLINKKEVLRGVILILFFGCYQFSFAQEGGPPMLTDDARVADYKEWEINTSLNSSVTNRLVLSTPHIDLNYGLFERIQLKIEAPLWLTFKGNGKVDPSIGEVIGGVKILLLEEERHFVSLVTFPQYTFNLEKGFYLPLFVERTFGQFLGGIAVAHFIGESNRQHSEIGGLIGYKPNDMWNMMVEYYSYQNYYDIKGVNGYVNVGFRTILNEHWMIMGSFGTQVVTPVGEIREQFISWLGVKMLF